MNRFRKWLTHNFTFSFERLIQKHRPNKGTVIHIGANFGQEADIYDRYGFESVIWVEADPDFCEILRRNLKDYDNHYVVEGLVSTEDGKTYDFTRMSNDGSSTKKQVTQSWEATFPELEVLGSRPLTGYRLETLLGALPNAHALTKNISLMVVDIEGSEMDALESAGCFLERVDFAWIEVSLRQMFEGGPLYSEISQYMSVQGFFPVDAKFGVGSGDVLYKRGARPSLYMSTLGSPSVIQLMSALKLTDLFALAKTWIKKGLENHDSI